MEKDNFCMLTMQDPIDAISNVIYLLSYIPFSRYPLYVERLLYYPRYYMIHFFLYHDKFPLLSASPLQTYLLCQAPQIIDQ